MNLLKKNYKFILMVILSAIFTGYGAYVATTYKITDKSTIDINNFSFGVTNVQAAGETASNIKDQITAITEDLGNVQVVGVKYFGLVLTLLENQTALSYDFGSIEGATGYIVVPYVYQWYIPYNGSLSGTTYSFNVLSIDGTAHNGRIFFYVIGYKNI